MTTLTNANYKSEVQDFLGTVLIVFTSSSDTIGPKTLDFLSSKPNQNFKLCVVDFDEERELVQKYSIRRLPNVFVVKNGRTRTSVSVCEDETSLQKLLSEV